MREFYVATVPCSVAATVALVAPVVMHRLLIRERRLKVLESATHRLDMGGIVLPGSRWQA
jgi:Family of unknown function (DUF6328)